MKPDEKSTPPRANILIVDDTPANLQVLSDLLKQRGIHPRPVPSGKLALQAAELDAPDLILLDITMPEMDGYEVCQRLKAQKTLKEIPVIFISALTETLDKVKAFSVGGVDYITKPFQIDEVYARVETHLQLRRLQQEHEQTIQHLEQRVQNQVREISASQLATIFALAKLAESRDDDTGKHLERVRTFCKLLATRLGDQAQYRDQISAAFIEDIYQASPLHDIGKVGIPDAILLKPGKLSGEEFERMKLHTILGAQTLEAVSQQYPSNPLISMGRAIARHHHERWDGTGYPDGLAGEAIPLAARIMAVADVYDALRSKRVYKPGFPPMTTLDIMRNSSGTHFDPGIVSIFDELHEELDTTYERMKDPKEATLRMEVL
jgi:putative two-component system response regulator